MATSSGTPAQRWPSALWIVRHGQSAGNVARDAADASGVTHIDIGGRDADVPLSELARYASAVEGVDPAAVERAAKAFLDPKAASIVVVGNAKQIAEPLRKVYPNLEVIPASALKLDSAALR